MKVCPGCGAVNVDDRLVCGVCSRSLAEAVVLHAGEQPPPPPVQQLPRNLCAMSSRRLVGILATIGIATVLTIGGFVLDTTPVGYRNKVLGVDMLFLGIMIFMALILAATGGSIFSGWRDWGPEWVRKKNTKDPRMAPKEPEEDTTD